MTLFRRSGLQQDPGILPEKRIKIGFSGGKEEGRNAAPVLVEKQSMNNFQAPPNHLLSPGQARMLLQSL